jgi:hypothetical protein
MNAVEVAVGYAVSLVQRYGFVLLFLGVVAYFAKGKMEEWQSARSVTQLNGSSC